MNLQSLTLEELISLKDNVDFELSNRNDGFFYVSHKHCYGHASVDKYENNRLAKDAIAGSGEGDNYLISIYTNNKSLEDESGFYYIESEDKVPEIYPS